VTQAGVDVTLGVDVHPDIDPVALEEAIASEGRRAARQLYAEALRLLDEQVVQASGLPRHRLEGRWVATLVGRIRIRRYRVRDRVGSGHPLDRALGLGASQVTVALRKVIFDLALRLPYRQAAEVASRMIGETLPHQSVWRVLQEEARVANEETRAGSRGRRHSREVGGSGSPG
jgi:hypothetical protein